MNLSESSQTFQANGFTSMHDPMVESARRWGSIGSNDSYCTISIEGAQPYFEFSASDSTVLAGWSASPEVLDKETLRDKLVHATNFFFTHGVPDNEGTAHKISFGSCQATKRFLRLMPKHLPLPTISTDGDGGVMLYWHLGGRDMVVTVDPTSLHFVNNAGTNDAEYFEDLLFDGVSIPVEILNGLKST